MSDYLKCDAVGCDHLEIVGELDAAMIGKPCPKCGANLLTSEDFDQFVAIKSALSILLPTENLNPGDAKDAVTLHVHEGTVTIKPGRTGVTH